MSTPHPMTIALERGLRSMKIELPDHTQLQLLRYLDEMARWNTAYNLTAIRKAGDMVIRHLLDSLALLPILQALPGYPELRLLDVGAGARSEEHTSELQSLMRISYAVFCLTKKNKQTIHNTTT